MFGSSNMPPATTRESLLFKLKEHTLSVLGDDFKKKLHVAFCDYLIGYLSQYEANESGYSNVTFFPNKLKNLLTRAIESLKHPEDPITAEFIAEYNRIGTAYDFGFTEVKSLNLIGVDAPHNYPILESVIKDVFRIISSDYWLYANTEEIFNIERNTLSLYFQKFLEQVWRRNHAEEKERSYDGACLSGVFGRTRLTTFHAGTQICFEFSDATDRKCAFEFRIPADVRDGCIARFVGGNVSLIPALEMLSEVTTSFDLDDYREAPEMAQGPTVFQGLF